MLLRAMAGLFGETCQVISMPRFNIKYEMIKHCASELAGISVQQIIARENQ